MITLPLPEWIWTRADSRAACQEGWDLFEVSGCTDDGKHMIQRLDDPASDAELGFADPKFEGDDEAITFVAERGRQGSELHAKACALHGTTA